MHNSGGHDQLTEEGLKDILVGGILTGGEDIENN